MCFVLTVVCFLFRFNFYIFCTNWKQEWIENHFSFSTKDTGSWNRNVLILNCNISMSHQIQRSVYCHHLHVFLLSSILPCYCFCSDPHLILPQYCHCTPASQFPSHFSSTSTFTPRHTDRLIIFKVRRDHSPSQKPHRSPLCLVWLLETCAIRLQKLLAPGYFLIDFSPNFLLWSTYNLLSLKYFLDSVLLLVR